MHEENMFIYTYICIWSLKIGADYSNACIVCTATYIHMYVHAGFYIFEGLFYLEYVFGFHDHSR